MIYYYDFTVEENELLYGPGKRVVFWTQGCSIGCKGCTSMHLWTHKGAKLIAAEKLIEYILSQENIEGITLHGGEPADQLDALIPVLEAVQKAGLSVISFTGYEIEKFVTANEKKYVSLCDLIICGPFEIDKLNRFLHFRGSTNQRIIKVTERYKDYEIKDGNNIVLLNISENGKIKNKGFPDDEMNDLIKEFAKRREFKNDS